ncbi:MAG: S8 family serine peptidase [Clostridia bacterium]|nr:S8 family serine peptidase [Clostridia bacterium]MCI9085999.1 S8 family serine peptidase [Clostridia bacterium]
MKKRLTSILIALSMMAGIMPVIGHAETKKAIDDSAMIEPEIITDSDTYVDDYYSYEEEIIEEEKQSSDRFIVKYKTENQEDRKSLQASAKSAFKELKAEKEKKIEALQKNLSEDAIERLHTGKEKGISKLFSLKSVSVNEMLDNKPEYEVIELEESINKQHFVAQIEAEMGDAIEYIQPDIEMEMSSVNATEIVSAVSDKAGNLSQAHNVSTGTGVTVALIDTGVDITHSALLDKVVTGWDFFNDTELTYSKEQSSAAMHGTHIAGIISQIAPDAKIMPLKVFEEGKAYTSDIIKAIKYAEENGADIVNCSWGNSAENPVLKEIITESDMFFVAAAGNNRVNLDETPVYPASYALDNVINVTSVNQDGGMSYFSNYGESIDIAAWGRDVYSAMPNNEYGNMTGTSMSAGYVAGAAALVAATGTPVAKLKDTLKSSANKVSTLENIVDNNNLVDFTNVVYDIYPQEITYVDAEDDFDRWKEKTSEESWKLFNVSKNVQVSSGSAYCLALKEDGTVWAWGRNWNGELGDGTRIDRSFPSQVIGLTNIKNIVSGAQYSFAIKQDGTIWAWGNNSYGQLGDGTRTERYIPIQIESLNNVISINLGNDHSAAIKEDGTVWLWGRNEFGKLGDSSTENRLSPTQILELDNVLSIELGSSHSMALKKDGTVWTWGWNNYGQLGDGQASSHLYRTTPMKVDNLTDIESISCGTSCCMAVQDDGSIWSWGYNKQGQLGDGSYVDRYLPVKIDTISDIIYISSGSGHNVALKEDGRVLSWGSNIYGQLGDGTYISKPTPTEVDNLTGIASVTASGHHSIALKDDGTIVTWGNNDYGVLCDGSKLSHSIPIQSLVKNVKIPNNGETVLDTNSSTALVVKEDGTVWGWGSNPTGQLGNESDKTYSIPVEIEGLTDVVSVSIGSVHAIALKKDGTVWSWGRNNLGQLGIGSNSNVVETLPPVQVNNLDNIIAIDIGYNHSVALRADGTVWTWGYNGSGQLGDGTTTTKNTPVKVVGLENVVYIATGSDYSFAIQEDGTVWGWGRYSYGHYGPGDAENVLSPRRIPALDNMISLKSQNSSSLIGLKSDGTVWKWGNGNTEKLYPVEGLKNVKSIAAIGSNYFALKDDGTVFASKFINNAPIVQVENLDNVQVIAPYMAVKEDGTLYTWGENINGQCVNGRALCLATPYCIDNNMDSSYIPINVIFNPAPITKVLGELIANTELPETISAYLDNGEYKNLNVEWDISTFDPQQEGEQTIYGEIQLENSIINPQGLIAAIQVEVERVKKNLSKIEAGYKHIVGLTSEGEIKVAGRAANYPALLFPSSPLNITGWNNSDDRIIDVYAVADNTVALTEHGKVFASGKIAGIKRPGQSKKNKQIIEEDWSNVEAIYVGYSVIAAKMGIAENGKNKTIIKYVTSSDADNALVAALENLNNDRGLNDIGNPMFAIGSVHYIAKGANSWHSSYMPQGANDNRSLPSGLQDISALFAESRYSAAIFDRIVDGEVLQKDILAITGYKADNTTFSHNLSVNTNNPPTTTDFVGVKKVAGYEDGYAVLMNDGTVSYFDIGSADRQLEIPENTVFPDINDLTEVRDLAINKGALIAGDLPSLGIEIMNSFAVCLKRDGTVKLIELFDDTALQEFNENYGMNGVNNNGLDAVNTWKLF